MRKTYDGKEEQMGFELQKKQSRIIPAITVTDLDFADDLAVITKETNQAQLVLTKLENEAGKVGLHCNAKKTELQAFNQEQPVNVKSRDGIIIKEVENFKYLGAWMESSDKDISVRKALAWNACHKLRKIWTSKISKKIKTRLFIATVESVLLYGAETWTLTKATSKQLDGCYTRMLRMAYNISWKEHMTNELLYNKLPAITLKIQQRRMRLAGHCYRHTEEVANELIIWKSNEGFNKRGRRRNTFIDNLLLDTGTENIKELKSLMIEREDWRQCIFKVERLRG